MLCTLRKKQGEVNHGEHGYHKNTEITRKEQSLIQSSATTWQRTGFKYNKQEVGQIKERLGWLGKHAASPPETG